MKEQLNLYWFLTTPITLLKLDPTTKGALFSHGMYTVVQVLERSEDDLRRWFALSETDLSKIRTCFTEVANQLGLSSEIAFGMELETSVLMLIPRGIPLDCRS